MKALLEFRIHSSTLIKLSGKGPCQTAYLKVLLKNTSYPFQVLSTNRQEKSSRSLGISAREYHWEIWNLEKNKEPQKAPFYLSPTSVGLYFSCSLWFPHPTNPHPPLTTPLSGTVLHRKTLGPPSPHLARSAFLWWVFLSGGHWGAWASGCIRRTLGSRWGVRRGWYQGLTYF